MLATGLICCLNKHEIARTSDCQSQSHSCFSLHFVAKNRKCCMMAPCHGPRQAFGPAWRTDGRQQARAQTGSRLWPELQHDKPSLCKIRKLHHVSAASIRPTPSATGDNERTALAVSADADAGTKAAAAQPLADNTHSNIVSTSSKEPARQFQQEHQQHTARPAWPWPQGSSRSNSSSSDRNTNGAASNSESSSTGAQIRLPITSFWNLTKGWDVSKQLSQLANMSQTRAAAADWHASAAHEAATPADQRDMLISLAAVLRQIQPDPKRTDRMNRTKLSSSGGGLGLSSLLNSHSHAAVVDDAPLAAAQLLQRLRNAMSDAAWEHFVEGLQLQATDAVQLVAAQPDITTTLAGNGYDSTTGSSSTQLSQVDNANGKHEHGMGAVVAASPTGSSMCVSGRHMITHLPAMTSATATSLHQQHLWEQHEQHYGRAVQPTHSLRAVPVHPFLQQQWQLDDFAQQHPQHQHLHQHATHLPSQLQQPQQSALHSSTLVSPVAGIEDGTQQHHAAYRDHSSRVEQDSDLFAEQHQRRAPKQQPADNVPTSHGTHHVTDAGTGHSSSSNNSAGVTTVASAPVQPSAVSITGSATDTSSTLEGGSVSASSSHSTPSFPKYEYLVFGGGGARCFGYAGALHALQQLGLIGHLKGVSGSSGGAVYALLAALEFSVSEVQAAMGTLPETETLSWLRLNSRLGLSDGEATFRQIEAAISSKLGVAHPTLADVSAAAGCSITLAATSLARRAPVYLSSTTHPDMMVRDALRASAAIPFFFTPLRGPGGDLLVDGCITDCTPLQGLKAGLAADGHPWDPQRTLVLAVHDASGIESPDFQGLLSGLVATVLQAGFYYTAAAGIDLLNLWPAVANVNPLQFRLRPEQARDVIAASQALAEEFAVKKMKQWQETAAAAPASSISGDKLGATSGCNLQPHDVAGVHDGHCVHSSSSSSGSHAQNIRVSSSSISSHAISDEDWSEEELETFMGVDIQGADDEDEPPPVTSWQQQQRWHTNAGLGNLNAANSSSTARDRWLGRLAVEGLLRAAGVSAAEAAARAATVSDHAAPRAESGNSSRLPSVLTSHISETDWQLLQSVLQQQEQLLIQQEEQLAAVQQQQQVAWPSGAAQASSHHHHHQASSHHHHHHHQAGSPCEAGTNSDGLEVVVLDHDGISQVHLMTDQDRAAAAGVGSMGSCNIAGAAASRQDSGGGGVMQQQAHEQQHSEYAMASVSSYDGRDCPWIVLSTWDELLHG